MAGSMIRVQKVCPTFKVLGFLLAVLQILPSIFDHSTRRRQDVEGKDKNEEGLLEEDQEPRELDKMVCVRGCM